METQCRQCSQRLRYADSLVNPVLRCPRCGETFRADLPSQPAEVRGASLSPLGTTRNFTRDTASAWEIPAAQAVLSTDPTPVRNSDSRLSNQSDGGSYPRFPASDELVPDPPPPSVTRPAVRPAASASWSGWGWTITVVVLLVFKAGPRVVRHWNRGNQPQQVPVQVENEPRQALERVFRDIDEQLAKERMGDHRGVEPPQPDTEPVESEAAAGGSADETRQDEERKQ
ncbi:MAG: hypothetical protein AB7F89_09520 [Pirellulaceae bacterium]